MVQFLLTLMEWLSGFAMMFLGLSYTTTDPCDVALEVFPIQYVEEVEVFAHPIRECVEFEVDDEADVEVFRI